MAKKLLKFFFRKQVFFSISRSSHRRYSIKQVFLKIWQNSQESICVGVNFFIKVVGCNFIKKGIPTRLFTCEICEISKNTFFTEHLLSDCFFSSKSFLAFRCFYVSCKLFSDKKNNA